jgi:Cu(I)/Ag(I) efflux system protein CusF
MKGFSLSAVAIATVLAVPPTLAQQTMDEMMKGKDMGGMMKGMDMGTKPGAAQSTHKAAATVKKADPRAGTVTLAHEPVKSLNWPSMTMSFKVADPKLFDKLAEGKQVEVEFQQSGKDYVVTSVK